MVVDLTYSEVEPVFTEIKYLLPFRIIQKENRSRSKHVNQNILYHFATDIYPISV